MPDRTPVQINVDAQERALDTIDVAISEYLMEVDPDCKDTRLLVDALLVRIESTARGLVDFVEREDA